MPWSQSLTIANSRDVVVAGVRSVDSELFHLVVLQCHGVTVRGVTVEAPADSPNTDGIHLHMSSQVSVYDARISTGDDCISIGPGNSHIWIERVACGPGHGIRYVAGRPSSVRALIGQAAVTPGNLSA